MRFPTYFQVPKSSAHFSNTQNVPGLRKKEAKKPIKKPPPPQKKNPKTPSWSQWKQSWGFSDWDSQRGAERGGCQRRDGWPGDVRAAGDPSPLELENCVVLGHPGAAPEQSIGSVPRYFYGLAYCKVNRGRWNSEGFHSQCRGFISLFKALTNTLYNESNPCHFWNFMAVRTLHNVVFLPLLLYKAYRAPLKCISFLQLLEAHPSSLHSLSCCLWGICPF